MPKGDFLKNWDAMRIFRLIVGLFIAVYGICTKDYVLLMFSAFFLLQAILNISCCGIKGCGSPKSQDEKGVYEDQVKPFKP
ncbi:MAG: hypothetical protein BGN96_00345 [Bacteroidales bacterium 45-6]|nr:MAG: hypothetical protein BGN96_00345 [Bacteroidales bacterium 45-6]